MKGEAQRGNQLAFGSFGIKALENKWITGRQIEAARIAVTRYMLHQKIQVAEMKMPAAAEIRTSRERKLIVKR